MFDVDIIETRGAIRVTIAGRFVRDFVEEGKRFMYGRRGPVDVTVNISGISFVDFYGEKALTWMRMMGAKFVACSPYSLRICRRLHLPVAGAAARQELVTARAS